MAKKTPAQRRRPKKYDLKIPYSLFEQIDQYIEDNPELGYTSVSQYLNEMVRQEVKRIRKIQHEDNKK